MRLKEIAKRLSAIKEELEANENVMTEERIAELESEVKALKEERDAIMQQSERRAALLDKVAKDGGKTLRSFSEGDADDKFATMEYRKAFKDYVLRGKAIPVEYRADAVTGTADAGVTIPTTVLNQIIEKIESVGTILGLVTRTSYKGGVSIPYASVKPTASWVSEGAGSDKQKKSIDGTITFAYHKLRCAVAVTLEVDTMSIAAFESLIISNITEAMTRAIEQSIISGTGSGQPEGITTKTPEDGQLIEISEQAYDDLINAEAALPVDYERDAAWCMSKKTFMGYYGLVDANGQPIGRVDRGIASAPEYTLLGRKVVICDYLPGFSAAASGDVVAFIFNFKDYVLNTNYSMSVKKYEDNDTDDFITKSIMIVDGKVVDTNSYVAVKKN